MRVSQLDSHLLDAELLTLLSANIDSALSLYRTTDTVTTVSKTLLRAVIWKIGIWDHENTYGSQLQSLRYLNLTKSKKITLGLVSVLGPLIQEKIGGELQGRWRQIVAYAVGVYEVLALANFISYIAGSRYDTVLHRILGVQLRPISSAYRAVSFEFLNRQLIWSQFTEFLLVFLPLVNLPRIRRKLTSYLPQPESQKLAFLPRKICAICYSEGVEAADCVNPYVANCGDIFCYGCIMSQISLCEGEGWDCLRCGIKVLNARPWFEVADSPGQSSRVLLTHSKQQQDQQTDDEDSEAESDSEGSETGDDYDTGAEEF